MSMSGRTLRNAAIRRESRILARMARSRQNAGRGSRITPYEHPSRARRRPPSPDASDRVSTSRRAGRPRITEATVLFADLRGYTGMAERLSAWQVLPLLDEFQRTLAAATERYGGTVFHLAGDGMMAGFGVAKGSSNGAREALAAGHAMLKDFAPSAARFRSMPESGSDCIRAKSPSECWDRLATRPPRWWAIRSMWPRDFAAGP